MNAAGRYAPIQSDAQGRLLAETIGILFGVDPAKDQVQLLDAATGERLLSPIEIEERSQATEAEIACLRAEIERLRQSRDPE